MDNKTRLANDLDSATELVKILDLPIKNDNPENPEGKPDGKPEGTPDVNPGDDKS
jgi:hypothetical protein